MRSPWEFVVLALLVTLTPGPATATVIRVAARDGRRAALSAALGNSVGVLLWGALSALGVSSLILASRIAFDALRLGGAAVLIVLGVRSLLQRAAPAATVARQRPTAGWRTGLVSGAANPKLAVFFVALFPQFLTPGTAVLPTALAMAIVIVAIDILWFSALAWAVDRAGAILRPRVRPVMERVTGTVMLGLGIRLAAEAR